MSSTPLIPDTSCCHPHSKQALRRLMEACTNLPVLEATYSSSSYCIASPAKVCRSFAPNFVRKPKSSRTCSVTSNALYLPCYMKAPRRCSTTQDRFMLGTYEVKRTQPSHTCVDGAGSKKSVKRTASRTTDPNCLISSITVHFVCTLFPQPHTCQLQARQVSQCSGEKQLRTSVAHPYSP